MIRGEGVMIEFFTNRRGRSVTRQQDKVVRQFQHALPHGVQMGREEAAGKGFSNRSGKQGVTNETGGL